MNKAYGLWAVIFLFAAGCAGTIPVPPGGPGEKLLWKSQDDRPKWTIEEPDVDGDIMMFVGVSKRYATEAGGRDDAMRNATNNIVKYLGTLAKDKFENVSVSFGLDSTIIDPTASSRQYQKQLAANVTKKVKAQKWYMEKWDTPTGIGWKVFVLSTVPVDTLNDSFKKTAKDNMAAAKRRAKEAADDVARKQAENAAEFWEKMTKQGVVED